MVMVVGLGGIGQRTGLHFRDYWLDRVVDVLDVDCSLLLGL